MADSKASIFDKLHAARALLIILRADRDFVYRVTKTEIKKAAKALPKFGDFDGCTKADIPEIICLAEWIARDRYETIREIVYRSERFNRVASESLQRHVRSEAVAAKKKRRDVSEIDQPSPAALDMINAAVQSYRQRRKDEG